MTQIILKPRLRFIGFNLQWGRKKLVDLADIFDGTHQTPKYVKSGIPFVSVENINDLEGTTKFITEAAFKKDFKNKPQIDDILMTRITAGIIGATAIIRSNKPLGYYVSLAMIRRKTSIDVTFLNHAISSDFFKRELHKRIIHVAFPKKINLGDINDCVVSFPEEESEQQKIASFLTAVDRRIELLRQKKEKLERYKKGVMQQLFTRKIRFKADDVSEFPDWEEKKLGEVSKVFSGGTPSSSNPKFYGGHIPFIRSGEINSNETELWLTDEGLKNSSAKLVEKGDLLLAIYGATSGEVGISKITGAINQAILCIRWAGENAFLSAWLRLNKETLIQKYLQGGQGNLSGEIVKSYLIPDPHSEEQKKIVQFLTSLDATIENLNQQINQTQTWKKGLLQKMFV